LSRSRNSISESFYVGSASFRPLFRIENGLDLDLKIGLNALFAIRKPSLITANKPAHVGRNGSKTLIKSKIPIKNGLNIKTNDSIEDGLNEFKLKKCQFYPKNQQSKVVCVFLMVIWFEFRMGQYRNNNHQGTGTPLYLPRYISNAEKWRQNINQKNCNSSNVIFVHFSSVFENRFRIKTHNFHLFIACF